MKTPVFLIADDSPGKLLMLKTAVTRTGWTGEIVTAITTEGAAELIDIHEIHAAFIDYQIPTQNGLAVIRHLRAAHPTCLIAMVTGADNDELEQKAREAGADEFICTAEQSDVVESNLKDVLTKWMTLHGE